MHLSLKKKKKAVGFDGNKTKSKQKLTDFAQMNVDSTHSLRAWVSWKEFYLSLKVTELGLWNAIP